MLYSGSKSKIAKHLLPIILSGRKDRWYVEPFCGGANMIDKVDGKRLGSDSNVYLISLLKAVQRGWKPPEALTKEDYYRIKRNKEKYDSSVVCFAAVPCSFGAKWWGGYARNNSGKNYALAASRNIQKQAPFIRDVVFVNREYDKLDFPKNSIVYCDPPYKNTAGYGVKFDHNIFWEWCRDVARQGHSVFVSETEAPEDFCVLWEKSVSVRMNKNDTSALRVERLFTIKP